MKLLKLENVDEVYVKVLCDEDVAWELRDQFTFMVPGAQFSPQFKARIWDGKIRLFNLNKRTIYRGLVPHIQKFCEERNYDYEYDDEAEEFSLKEAKDFVATLNLPFEVRDYQYDAFVKAIRNRRMLMLSPTASGKSLIIYLILRYLHDNKLTNKSLIIVPTTSLVSQLRSDFASYGFDVDSTVHTVMAKKAKQSDLPITISTWQSLYTLPAKYFRQYDTIIGDEAHLFKAKSLCSIMEGCTAAKYRIGTTGTLDGTKTHKLVLEGLFGAVDRITTTKELMDAKHVADFEIKCLLLKHGPISCKTAKDFDYQEEMNYLVGNDERNKFIANLALSLPGNTLVLYQYVEKHGVVLHELISKNADDPSTVFFVHGGVETEEREQIRHIVEKEKNARIVASFGVFSTGINIRNIHNIIFASPSKSKIRNLQSIGRGLRTSETKTNATLFDIADDLRVKTKENYTLKHFTLRLETYAEEKFRFKVYKISLKGP